MITTEFLTPQILKATINRPEARNAINFRVIEQLESLVDQIRDNDEIRIFLLTGEGTQSFISGGDLKEFHSITSQDAAVEMSKRMHELFLNIEQLPTWNVALINGDAYGGGIELMLAFDFILSKPDAKFGFTQGRFHLTPGWGGLTRLIEKVGRSKALEWLGKAEVHNAESMLRAQFLNAILAGENLIDEVVTWCEPLLKNSRDYISRIKRAGWGNSGSREASMQNEVIPFSELWVHPEHIARVERFMQRKK